MKLLLAMKEIINILRKMAAPLMHPNLKKFILMGLLYRSEKDDVIVETIKKNFSTIVISENIFKLLFHTKTTA